MSAKIELPLGLGMALGMNVKAMERFSSFTSEQKRQIIDRTHSIQSKHEMDTLVEQIAEGKFFL